MSIFHDSQNQNPRYLYTFICTSMYRVYVSIMDVFMWKIILGLGRGALFRLDFFKTCY